MTSTPEFPPVSRLSRELLQLRVALPLVLDDRPPETVATRPFVVGQDEKVFLELNALAFAHHPDQGNWTLAELTAREREEWFDPNGFLLYEERARLLGFCWTKVHAGTDPLGEIYVIAVHPSAQGRGLGRSLVLAGLEHLAAAGLSTGMLYVDRDNVAAVALYRRLGFTVDHRDVVLAGVIEPTR